MTRRLRVIAVAGPRRSGTTILSRVVAAAADGIAVGELEGFATRMMDPSWRCSCSSVLAECRIWSPCQRTLRSTGALNGVRRFSGQLRWFRLPTLIVPRLRGRFLRAFEADLEDLAHLLVTAAEVAGVDTIVDSSKGPSYLSVLAEISQVDLWVLHLVRDSRATGYSWRRRKKLWPGAVTVMGSYGTARASADWVYLNLGIELAVRPFLDAGRYTRVRYEDFVSDPRRVIDEIMTFLGEPESPASMWASETEVLLGSSHLLGGNPNRFDTGAVKVVADSEWRNSLGGVARVIITGMTWPLLARYGYLKHPGQRSGGPREGARTD